MSETERIAESVNKIAEAFSGLTEGSKLREEIARLKAINAKLGGEVAKKTVEISNLREAQGWQEIRRQHEEIRNLREELNFKEVEIKELKGSLESKDKGAVAISRNNARLRSELYDMTEARDAYRDENIKLRDAIDENIKLRDAVNEVRRVLDALNEED